MEAIDILFYLSLSIFIFILFRTIKIVRNIHYPTHIYKTNVRTLIVLGSGGHTGEILKIVSILNFKKYYPRTYIVASSDKISFIKAQKVEREKAEDNTIGRKEFDVKFIYRSREVGQSWFTSIFTTMLSFVKPFFILLSVKPDLILCNGPGSCVPLCLLAFIFNVFGILNSRLVFIESICRVKSLSLSGKILYFICNDFFLQWPYLLKIYPRAKYLGRLF